MGRRKVVVGMSGGIDSFVTALMLQQQGFDVIGVTLRLWGENDLTAVEKICSALHIPLHLRDGEEYFREKVVASFVRSYLEGCTPSPCCLCNGEVKWELLNRAAAEFHADHIATGHYVRIVSREGRHYIAKGADTHKDQSYFLWAVPREILAKAVTPLGEYTKAEVKAWAEARGYEEMAQRKESMGICFLRGKDYRDFIRQYSGTAERKGVIYNRRGQRIGEHSGVLDYTVGQKRGIPDCDGEPMYVAEIQVENNAIIADVKAGLFTDTLTVEKFSQVDAEDFKADDLTVKIRGLGLNPQGQVKIEVLPDGCRRVHLSDPAWAVAPGQPVAFYRGDLLVGGGIVKKCRRG